jgi:hypothetical protein
VPTPAPAPLLTGRNGLYRVSLRSGDTVYVFNAALNHDSIVGYDQPMRRKDAKRLAFAVADVQDVSIRRGDAFKTVAAVVGGVLAVTSLLVAACLSASTTASGA